MGFYGQIHALDSISGVTATASIDLGNRRYFNGEEYVYAYNNTGSAATQGAFMVASGLSGFSFTRSSTAAADFPMCAVKHATVPAANYFWGLVRGSLYILSAATLPKGTVIGIGADGVAQTHLAGSFPTGVAIGKMLENASGSTASLAHVRLFG
jgi:hypothetical protein